MSNKYIYWKWATGDIMKKSTRQTNEKNKTVSTLNNKEYLLNPLNHISIVNRLYLNETFEGSKAAQKHINKKISSYKQQDSKKNKLSIKNFIKQEELLEKLVISKLKCYYCRNKVLLFYENNLEIFLCFAAHSQLMPKYFL